MFNLLFKPMPTRLKPKLKRALRHKSKMLFQTGHQLPDSMLIRNIKPLPRQTKQSASLTARTLAGKLTYASFQKTIMIMESIAKLRKMLKISHNLTSNPNLK